MSAVWYIDECTEEEEEVLVMIGQKIENVKKCMGAGVMVCMVAAALLFPQGAGAEVVERIVAVVNQEIITLSELRAISIPYLQKMKQQYSVDYGDEQIIETEKRIIEQLIDEMLVTQEADKLGIEVTPKEIDMAMRDVKERNQLTEAQFEEALAEDGMTLEDYKKELTENYSLKTFHDTLLSYGSAPITVLRKLLLENPGNKIL